MPKFNVTIKETRYITFQVEAESALAARTVGTDHYLQDVERADDIATVMGNASVYNNAARTWEIVGWDPEEFEKLAPTGDAP